MNRVYDTLTDTFQALNPAHWGRLAWLQGKRGWRQLLVKASPDTRIFLYTGFFWTVPLAITEPFKSLYLNRLGLDNQALGGVNGLDMGMRTLGVIAGGWLGSRLGHKRVLIGGDLVSWVLSTLVLAFATQPWHLFVWAGLMSTNSLVSASVQHLLLKATPHEARARTYGFLNFSAVLPMVLFSGVASLLLKRFAFMEVMRALLVVQTLSMAVGIYWRWKRLGAAHEERRAGEPESSLLTRLTDIALEITATPGSWAVLAVWVMANVGGNLWRVYFSVFAVERCGQTEAMLGWMTQAGALAFVIVSLWLLPRLDAPKQPKAFLIANFAAVLPAVVLVFHPGVELLFLISIWGGAAAAIHAALMASLLASLLPERQLAMGFALLVAFLNLLLGASFPLAGWLYKVDFLWFPISMVGINLIQILAASLLERGRGRDLFLRRSA